MATHIITSDEDYIDMIITSYAPSHILCCSSSPRSRLSTSNNIEFEFQNPSSFDPIAKEATFIPTDELFHEGKLLPLYLRQTGQETLHGPQNPKKHIVEDNNNLYYSITLVSTSSKDQTTDDQDQPSLVNDECFFEWSIHELNGFVSKKLTSKNNKSWIDKVKLVFGRWMRVSVRAYLKSLFLCSEESCVTKKRTFRARSLACVMNNKVMKEGIQGSIMSLSSGTKRCSSTSNSWSFGVFSSCPYDAKAISFFRSSSDEEDGMEGSVDAAVDYCKKSMRILG